MLRDRQTEVEKQETGPQRQKRSQSQGDNSQMGKEGSRRGQCQLQDGVPSPSLSDPCSDIHAANLSSTA